MSGRRGCCIFILGGIDVFSDVSDLSGFSEEKLMRDGGWGMMDYGPGRFYYIIALLGTSVKTTT